MSLYPAFGEGGAKRRVGQHGHGFALKRPPALPEGGEADALLAAQLIGDFFC